MKTPFRDPRTGRFTQLPQQLDLNKVKILKHNSVYRVSDLVNRTGPRWPGDRKTILNDPLYKNTILYDYLSQTLHLPRRGRDLGLFKKILLDHTEKHQYTTADPNNLIVHMRLGDVMTMGYINRRNACRGAYRNFYNRFKLDKYSFSKITVVTALHFGASKLHNRYFYSDEARDISFKVLKDFEKQSNDVGLEVDIFSSENVDADLAYMASSKFFICGSSKLSAIIQNCLSKDSKILARV